MGGRRKEVLGREGYREMPTKKKERVEDQSRKGEHWKV